MNTEHTSHMMNPTRTMSIKGGTSTIEFRSAYATDAEAAAALRATPNVSDFGRDLLSAFARGFASAVQINWIHKLATDARSPAAPRAGIAGLNLRTIVELMDTAAEAQKRRPQITLTARDGGRVVLSRAGERSRTPGAVQITDGRPYGANTYYGQVQRDGSVVPARSWTFEIEAVLFRLMRDPAKVAAQHGVATGECSFCRRPLSTKESRSVGYGPDCAEKFGLPWGHVDPAVEAAHTAAQGPL